jgi:hypothetical protein
MREDENKKVIKIFYFNVWFQESHSYQEQIMYHKITILQYQQSVKYILHWH